MGRAARICEKKKRFRCREIQIKFHSFCGAQCMPTREALYVTHNTVARRHCPSIDGLTQLSA